MFVRFCQRMTVAIAVAACFPAAALANAARVDFAVGNVTAIGPDGRSRPLTRGSEISQGDTVNTQNGRAQLRFSDGAYMSLQPQTEFKIEEFTYAGKEDGKENIVMNLIKGGMRTITGLIGRTNRHSYKLKTEVATIGIRGTEYSVQYTNSIEVFCAGGSINLENQGGSLTIQSGQGASVQTQNTAPQQTSQPPVLSPNSTTQQKQQEEQQEATNDPTNPVQESTTPDSVTTQVAAATATKALLTGTASYNMAFAHYDVCQDACFDATKMLGNTGTLDSSGKLTSFQDGSGTTTIGTASVADAANDGVLAWGRWHSGMLGGDGTMSGHSFSGNSSFHYILGMPTPAADIGSLHASNVTATYTFMGGTQPTSGVGDLGTLTGGTLVARFGAMQVDVGLNLSISNRNYAVTANNLGISGSGFSGSGSTSGCLSACSTNVQGFFAGTMAERAGVAYAISDVGLKTFGTAGFKKP